MRKLSGTYVEIRDLDVGPNEKKGILTHFEANTCSPDAERGMGPKQRREEEGNASMPVSNPANNISILCPNSYGPSIRPEHAHCFTTTPQI